MDSQKHDEYVFPAVRGTCRKKTNGSMLRGLESCVETGTALYFVSNESTSDGHDDNDDDDDADESSST